MKGQSLIEQWMLEKKMSEDQMIMSALLMFAAGVDTVSLLDTCSYVSNATWRMPVARCMCRITGPTEWGSGLVRIAKGSLLMSQNSYG